MALRDDLAADAHAAWMDRMIADGVSSCLPSLTREEQLVPFAQLSAPIQQYDYDLVDVILASLETRGYRVTKAIMFDELPHRKPTVFLSGRAEEEEEEDQSACS